MYTSKWSSGFTLMELMMVVAILGILAGIAYPSYTGYVTQSKRSDGKAGLLSLQLAQEKYRANCPQYADGIDSTTLSCVSGGAHNLVASTASPDGRYTLAITAADATSYSLTATPTFTDTECNILGIDQAGTKIVSGGSGSVADCWDK